MTVVYFVLFWAIVIAVYYTVGRFTRRLERRQQSRRLEALADLTREPRLTLTEIIAATPGLVVYGCGCRPCPSCAAARAARDKAAAARDEWAAEWNERLHKQ